MLRVLRTELMKLKRSPVIPLSAVVVSIPSIMTCLMELRYRATEGMMNWKQMLGQSTLLSSLVLSIMLYGMMAVYLFAREYTDDTWKALMVMPVSRVRIVAAKLAVLSGWSIITSMIGWGSAVALGLLIGVPGFTAAIAWKYFWLNIGGALVMCSTMPVVIWVTMLAKNFIVPMGALVSLTVVHVFLLIGEPAEVKHFPWSFPALMSFSWEKEPFPLGVWSWVTAAALTMAGLTLIWINIRYQDQ